MAEAPVPIPPDVLVAALPAAEAPAAAEVPAADDNPVAPAEEVSWLLSLLVVCCSLRGPLLKCVACAAFAFMACVASQVCFRGECRLQVCFYGVCRLS